MQDTEIGSQSWWDRHRLHVLAAVLLLWGVLRAFGLFTSSSIPVLVRVFSLLSYLFVAQVVWLTVWVWSERTDPRWHRWWALGFVVLALAIWGRLASGMTDRDTKVYSLEQASYVFAIFLSVVLGISLFIVFFGGIGRWIGRGKGHARAGWWLGVLLGPIGWIAVGLTSPSSDVQAEQAVRNSTAVEAALNSDTRACPWCAETIKTAARLCRYCNREIDPAI